MRRNSATSLRKDALYREIAGMLRSMPTGWRREYNKGRRALVAADGPVLPDTPTPEQAMLLIGITAGGNPSGDTPYGPHEVPEEVRQAAMHGIRLSYREGYGAWMFIGLARAIELVIVPSVSDVTYSRMGKYLFRHAKDKRAARFGDDENPSNGYLAWLNWGGDPAAAWTRAFQRNPARKETYLEGVERREKKKGKGERAFDTAQTVGGLAVAGAKLGGRAIPVVGEVLMVAGAGKEAVKVARRRLKGGKGSWKSDLAKVGAGAFGLESFVPEAGAKPLKKNPAANVFGPKKPLFGPYTYRAKQNVNGDTLIAVYHGSKRIAHIDAFWAYSMRAIEEHEEEETRRVPGARRRRLVCASDLRALGAEGRYPNVLAVGHAFMDDDGYKGKGIGRAMYEAMMVEGFAVRETRISGQPGPLFFIPDECKGAGNTSAEAQRVWASLARDYPSQGTSIRVDAPPVIGSRAKVNPRRRNPRQTVEERIKRFERHEVRMEASKNLPLFGRGFLALAAQRYTEDEYVRLVAAAIELDGRWGLLEEPSAYAAPKGVLLKALKERYMVERTKPITVEVRFRDMWEATAYIGEGRYDRTEVGFVVAAPAYPLACPQEYATLRSAHGDAPTYEVVSSRVHPLMQQKGLGVRLYRALGETLGKEQGAYLFANACGSRGDTSVEAQRVYRSLGRYFPTEGLVVYFPPTKTNPRRIRNGTKAQARALIDAALCGDLDDDNFYHVTTESRLDAIARYGLESPLARLHREEPDIEPGSMLERVAISQRVRFGKMGEYSQDKVFVSHGLNTARIWADYIREMVDEDEQVVVLRIRPEAELYSKVYLDEKGTEDAGCSFYVTSTIKPQHLDVVPETTLRNPRRPMTAERTDPALWEAVKREVTAGSKGGRPGQWSARKAQLAVALYKQRGGDYWGPKSPRNALAKWTREDWRTRSGEPSLVTGERYLPARAIEALTPAEYAATTRAKREGMRRGEQFVAQPERIAAKTSRYRKNPGRC